MSAGVTVHATTVAIGGRGVMLTGASGAGKSDLALRLIDRGAVLISDDYTLLATRAGRLLAAPPATIAGRMEVRGLGIVEVPYAPQATVALVVALGAEDERMPEPRRTILMDVSLPGVTIDPRTSAAPIKVEWALSHLADAGPETLA
ncbi:MAG: HPr kinase/phosphatase C-terminal domain-containing protein [Sphingomonas adhaesiva]|uniref:HPr kinase/phosphorylase n=1 Tax=Sphingomonas adhaesiva TaxID=28212 RepID=UPI002FFD303C